MDQLFEMLKTLTETDAVTGYEDCGHKTITDMIKPLCDEVYADKTGSVVGIKRCGKKDAKRIMIEAHLDQIGFMVKSVEEGGFLTFTSVGGVDARTIPASTVTVHGKEKVFGVIGAMPPHLKQDGDKAPKISDLAIDTGLSDDKLKDLVRVGDVVTINRTAKELLGDNVCARALDDRAGCAILIKALEMIKDTELDYDIYAVFASQEEVTSFGAKCTAFDINPHFAVAVDVTHASTPDADIDGTTFDMGEGVVITQGGNIHPVLSERAKALCGIFDIKYQLEAEAGNTGTDAWDIQVQRGGVPVLLLSLPLRYMHTSVEVISKKDIEYTAKLIAKLAEFGGGF